MSNRILKAMVKTLGKEKGDAAYLAWVNTQEAEEPETPSTETPQTQPATPEETPETENDTEVQESTETQETTSLEPQRQIIEINVNETTPFDKEGNAQIVNDYFNKR